MRKHPYINWFLSNICVQSHMDAKDLERRLHEFAETLRQSGIELTNDVRERAIELVSEARQLLSESRGLITDRYGYLDATIRSSLDGIQDAFSEDDLYVIITAVARALAAIVTNKASDWMG